MIPTTATNTPTTQTSSSAMIGIASLVLEGRAVSDDEFAIPSGLVKNVAQRRSHIHHHQAAAGGGGGVGHDVGNSSNTIMTTSTTTSSSGTRPSQVVNITMNPNAIGIPLLTARTIIPAASLVPDTTHQRWTQKICQLRQSSPTVSREMALEMIAVGVDDDKSDLDRRMTLVYHHRPVPSPIADKLHTLQSLATTCLRASPDNTPNYGYTVLSSSPTSPLVPATTSPKYTYFTSPPRLATPFGMNPSLAASSSSPPSNSCCSGSPNGHNINSPLSSSTKKQQQQQPQQQPSSKGNGIGSSSGNSSSSSSCNTNPKQGPHCDQFLKKMGLAKGEAADAEDHICDIAYGIKICIRWRTHCQEMEAIMARGEPICIEVYLGPVGHKILLEQWIIAQKEKVPGPTMTLTSLCSAIRSQLYFSQISAWCDLIKKSDRAVFDTGRILFPTASESTQSGKRPRLNIFYRIKPYDSTASFNSKPNVHNFPNVVISESTCISVCVKSLPRINGGIPRVGECSAAATAAATVGPPPAITVAGIGALFSVTPIGCPSSPVSSSSGTESTIRRASISHLPSTSAAASINSVSSRDESMDKGKHKCMFDDDDGGCSSDATLSHREKQLMKYKKRMLKRDKKTCKKTASDSGGELSSSQQHQQVDESQEPPSSSMKYQPMQLDEKINGALDETTLADVASNGQQQTLPEYGSINSIRPPLYQPTPPTSSIAESVQTQLVEMISTGTQTANFPQSAAFPNCDLCGSEMSMVCLNCDENFAEITPLNKADLLLQAIQRTPKTARNRKPLKNNNNSPVMTHQTTRNISDCQVCKRQKTQHHFRRKEDEQQQKLVAQQQQQQQQQQQNNNNNCSNVMNGKCANGDGPPCDCGTTSFRMDEDDENHEWNDVKSNRTAIKENSSPTYLSNGNGVGGGGVGEVLDGETQFKTPNSQITSNGTSSLIVAQPACVKPSLLHIFNGVDKRRTLPKVNLTQIFCAATSSPIPISCPSPETTFTFDIVNGTTTTTSLQSPDANIPVQKSYSAPTLPNSPSLSPRFAKQAAIYKRRSRHLSDRSDRSSLGSDEQFSDEELEGGIYSPASSPMKCRSRTMGYGRKPLLGNLEESLLQRRFLPKTEVAGFKVLLGASGAFCPTQLTIPASAYFYELRGEALSTPYVCEIRLPRKGYLIPSTGTVQATLLNPMGTVVRMFVIPYDFRDMPPLHQTFIRQRILAEESSSQSQGERTADISGYKGAALSMMSRMHGGSSLGHMISSEHMKRLRYSIHLRFQTSRSGRLTLHTDIRLLISRRTDCDTAAAHAKGVLEAPNDLTTDTVMPNHPKYSARQENPNKI